MKIGFITSILEDYAYEEMIDTVRGGGVLAGGRR